MTTFDVVETLTMTSRRLDVCLIGAGPRGLSVLERMCANAAAAPDETRVTVHVVDPYPPGAGQVWRTDQPEYLLMNTVASQVTMFTDDSLEIEGPVRTGPSLYEWARSPTLTSSAYDERVRAEARALGPDSYPSRSFYGHYLEWVFRHVVRTSPGQVTVVVHSARAVALDEASGKGEAQCVLLADGTVVDGLDAVVLAQGHLPVRDSRRQEELARFAEANGLEYITPASPADVDLSRIRPGETVALLGLGLNFIDYMALLTLGRGGRFARASDRLVYLPSGREPRLVAGSRRGLPFHARGENQKGPHGRHTPAVLTAATVHALRERSRLRGGIDFRAELWPLVAKEVETVYYTTLLTTRGRVGDAERLRARYLKAESGAGEHEVLEEFGVAGTDRWEWARIAQPCLDREFSTPRDFRDWLLGYLRNDLTAARTGNVDGPLKSALDVLRDLRNELRLVIDHGGLTGSSQRRDLDGWYTPLNAFLSIGPPAQRIEEAIALIEADVLQVLGPGVRASADRATGAFSVESTAVPGSLTRATTLIEARLPGIDLRQTTDPLLSGLLREGNCRAYEVADPDGSVYRTGGLTVTDAPFRVIDAGGRAHPRRFAFGVPTESVHWATAAGIRPGVNSVTLQDSDAIARALLALPRAERAVQGTDRRADEMRISVTGELALDTLDTGLLSPVRAGTPAEAVTSDGAWLQAMLDAEAALVRAQAHLGNVPEEAARSISDLARADHLNVRELAVRSREAANPVVALVQAFTKLVAAKAPEAADYVHRGSTSQDIFDTALMLVAGRTLDVLVADLEHITGSLEKLAARHTGTLMAGRTLGLHAVPTTFGLKAAGWLTSVRETADRLKAFRADGLVVQLGGAAGTLAGYLAYEQLHRESLRETVAEDYARRLTQQYAVETGLAVPVMPWHSHRRPIAALAAELALATGVLGKIAVDVQSLARTETAEVAEPSAVGRGVSSAMPQKRNPVLATLIRSAALQVPAYASVLTHAMLSEDERSAGAWHAEWLPLRECLRLSSGAAHTARELVAGLQVSPERMRVNLGLTGGLIVAERLAAVLAPTLGKAAAKEVVSRASAQAAASGTALSDVLAHEPEVAELFDAQQLAVLLDPASYTGAAGDLVRQALRQ